MNVLVRTVLVATTVLLTASVSPAMAAPPVAVAPPAVPPPAVAAPAVAPPAADARPDPSGGPRGTVGAPGVGDPFFPHAGNGGIDVQDYSLVLAYDPPTRRLTGTATLRIRATQDLSRFNLDLRGFVLGAVTVDRAPATVARDGQELIITPKRVLRKGSAFTVVVPYSGVPVTVVDPDGSSEGWVLHRRRRRRRQRTAGLAGLVPGQRHPAGQGHLHRRDDRPQRAHRGRQRGAGVAADAGREDHVRLAGALPDGALPHDDHARASSTSAPARRPAGSRSTSRSTRGMAPRRTRSCAGCPR